MKKAFTSPVFYSTVSNNGQECESQFGPLTVSSENGFLVWEPNDFIAQAREFRPTVNIHASDGSYVTTVSATDGRWQANQSGGYFFVAVVGPDRDVRDWRTWRSSEIAQCVTNAITHNGQATVFLERSSNGPAIEITEILPMA